MILSNLRLSHEDKSVVAIDVSSASESDGQLRKDTPFAKGPADARELGLLTYHFVDRFFTYPRSAEPEDRSRYSHSEARRLRFLGMTHNGLVLHVDFGGRQGWDFLMSQ